MRIRALTLLAALCLLVATTASARADKQWERGLVPEGSNAFTVARRELRLDLFGRSSFGITDHTEVSTYLALDAVLFPNLELKVNVADGPRGGWSFSGGVGAGVLPYAGGGGVPFPPIAVGVAGVAGASIQHLGTQLSWRPARPLTLTLRGNLIALEAATVAIGGIAAPGVIAPLPIGVGTVHAGFTAGAEADLVLGPSDTLMISADAAHFRGADEYDVYAVAGWTHAWQRFHLFLGANTLVDLPDLDAYHNGHSPLLPWLNVYWTWQ